MTEYAVLALIFGVVSLLIVVLGALTTGPGPEEETDLEPPRRLFGPLNGVLAELLPTTAEGRSALQQDMWLAGYRSSAAVNNFLVVRNLLTLAPLLGGLLSVLAAPDGNTALFFLITGLVLAGLGYAVPRVVLSGQASARSDRLRSSLPIWMDTLALTLSTGLGLTPALARSGAAIRRGHPDLADELRVVARQAELRSLSHALEQWKKRIPLPEVGSIVFLLTQSDRLGTDVIAGLWELSASYRVNARQLAEAAANRMNFFLLFPTVLLLLPAAGIILIGPPGLQALEEAKVLEKALEDASDVSGRIKQAENKLAVPTGTSEPSVPPPIGPER
jgi:tight adherence protein C